MLTYELVDMCVSGVGNGVWQISKFVHVVGCVGSDELECGVFELAGLAILNM